VESPCCGVCRIESASGLCVGCLRTLDEIACWTALAPKARATVLSRLATRRLAAEEGGASSRGGEDAQAW